MSIMSDADVKRIEGTLFFEQPEMRARLIRFAMLIVFASTIATGGLISNSVASVIGAMIVVPLMTPIMGIVVAIVIGSKPRLLRSAIIVLSGIGLAILIGWLMASLMPYGWEPTNSDQVMSRTSPQLLDLVIALASGGAGAYALSRLDVADALPGVAISISLVPPLCTAGILLAASEWGLAIDAMVLFLTNIGAILMAGTVTFVVAGLAKAAHRRTADLKMSFVLVALATSLIAVPLWINSNNLWADANREEQVLSLVQDWLTGDWVVYEIEVEGNQVEFVLAGEGELPPSRSVFEDINAEFDGNAEIVARIVEMRQVEVADSADDEP